MKKYVVYFLMITLTAFYACNEDDNVPQLELVTVQVSYPANSAFSVLEGLEVKMTAGPLSYTETTNAEGKAEFTVPVGIYDISVSTNAASEGGSAYVYNGLKTSVAIAGNWNSLDVVALELIESKSSQVIIKELFIGGSLRDDGSGVFLYDRYLILYNNSATTANLGNMCLATIAPYNAQSSNDYYTNDGVLLYEAENWIPASQAIWYFQKDVSIEPGKQIVVALANAVNNTVTYSKSINFDNAQYYCTYDPDKFTHAATYPSPAASIPTNQYLKAEKLGAGTAWTLSVTSPGLFIFETDGITPSAFAADVSLTHTLGAYVSKKVPVSWVVDGLEAFLLNNANNKKRFTSAVDAGYVYHVNQQGYSIYRNVDKAATEALAENAGKLVYNYSLGTSGFEGGTTDPSGIDAEASAKNGARIIYKDTNSSTNDFHLRKEASLRN